MGRKGAWGLTLTVGLGYPLMILLMVFLVLKDDPFFPDSIVHGGIQNVRDENGLTRFQNEHGIGPMTKVVRLGAIDPELAKKGENTFRLKCSGCHKLGERYVGPPLRGVTEFRSPTYIMNMVLNPAGMVQQHPVAKGLLGQYYTVMSPQGMDEAQALAVIEFLRLDFKNNNK